MNDRRAFTDRVGFTPDRFQLQAFDAVDRERNVVVAAPTGSGKTLVAAYAVDRALRRGVRAFYTTPIKALSNQKYLDLVRDHGADQVGLLTGDNAINGDAPVVVMTTEVLRNMLYAGARLDELGVVVLDEVHYLQDAYRGPVWEEVIIHCPTHVRLVCLSATVSNADQLTEWITTVRGETELVVETRRPVELDHLYLIGDRSAERLHLVPTLVGGRANPQGSRFDPDARSDRPATARRRGEKRPRRKWRTPRRTEVIELLHERDLLPVIYFLFSRAGCDDAAKQLLRDGVRLTSTDERERIGHLIDDHLGALGPDERDVLGYDQFTTALQAGIAAHHAGMIPPFKQLVEACFTEGLVKVVFATETLALGINMPARTVVIEKLTKFTGEHHEFLTPAQYTQLTGRAGRRGIDTHGQAVVLWSPFVTFDRVASLALSRSFVLTSSFRPTYNMAVNLVRRYDQHRARHLLNLSFGQFRADAEVVRAEHRRDGLEERRRQVLERIEAEFGAVEQLRGSFTSDGGVDRQAVAEALSHLQPGSVVELVGADVPDRAAVLAVAFRKGGMVRARVVDVDTGIWEVTPDLLDALPLEVGTVELPEPYLPASTTFAHEVAQRLTRTRLRRRPRARAQRSVGGPDGPALPKPARRALKQLEHVERDLAFMERRAEGASDSLAHQFDRVITLLEERGHLDGWSLTPSGERVARIYHECDLLIAEAHEAGLLDGLGAADLTGLVACFVYEERRPVATSDPWFPSRELRDRFERLSELHRRLNEAEQAARLPLTRAPDAGFTAMAAAWAAGGDLDDVLRDEEVTAGDFVRTAKQLIDLLRQLATVATAPATRRAASAASDAVFRGVVAASSVIEEPDEDDELLGDGPLGTGNGAAG